jgi:hypothetical protein
MEMDGVSDFSTIINGLLNDIAWLVSSKVKSAIFDSLHTKVVPLINKVIDSIPTDIPIPNTDLHFYLAYAAQPTSVDE